MIIQMTLNQFIDNVKLSRQWEQRTDDMVIPEMAYTFGFAQARMTIGGYVDNRDFAATLEECETLDKLVNDKR